MVRSFSDESLTKYRRLLPSGTQIADEAPRVLIDELTVLARAAWTEYLQRTGPFVKTGGVNEEERIEIEERAAILECDGKLHRARAEAIALAKANRRVT